MSRGHILKVFQKFSETGNTPKKVVSLKEKGQKRVKEWREVTFMKALDDTRIFAPADLR